MFEFVFNSGNLFLLQVVDENYVNNDTDAFTTYEGQLYSYSSGAVAGDVFGLKIDYTNKKLQWYRNGMPVSSGYGTSNDFLNSTYKHLLWVGNIGAGEGTGNITIRVNPFGFAYNY